MSASFSGEPELRKAFDAFSIWVLTKYISLHTTIKLICGQNINHKLRNYLVALVIHLETRETELLILEHRLTIRDYGESSHKSPNYVSSKAREYFGILTASSVKHYLNIYNEWPAIEATDPSIVVLNQCDMNPSVLSAIPGNVLCAISSIREHTEARDRCVYEIRFSNGKTLRKILQEAVSQQSESTTTLPIEPYYFTEPDPLNGISLLDLAADLNADCKTAAPFGLFIVRQGTLEDIKRYIKKNCIDREEDLVPSTWFLVNNTTAFEDTFKTHDTVHEVSYLQDYGIVFWLRSKGAQKAIAKHFTVSFDDQYYSVPPAPSSINVLISNETNGSTTYLKNLQITSKRSYPFRIVTRLNAWDVIDILRQTNTRVEDTLCHLFSAYTEMECFAVKTGQLLLLIDHATKDYCPWEEINLLVNFLNNIHHIGNPRLSVWIVGDDFFWEAIVANCVIPVAKYTLPALNEAEQRQCLELLIKDSSEDVQIILQKTVNNNTRQQEENVLGNVFLLFLISEVVNNGGQSTTFPAASFSYTALKEHFIWNHLGAAGSLRLEQLEEECFRCAMGDSTAAKQQVRTINMHRALRNLLAAEYLLHHPEKIDIKAYRTVGRKLIDELLFRHCPLAVAVLHHDVERARGMLQDCTPETLRSTTDCLQRNLLHIVHESLEIIDLLLSTNGFAIEQKCPQLNNWTPLQLADDSEDWPIVDKLLANGANSSSALKLRTMSTAELSATFNVCISGNYVALIEWFLENRTDLQISQYNIYNLSVVNEFDHSLLFRLLALAKEQKVPEREPPYKFIWDNSALDNAVADNRYDLAAFLVEHLAFQPTPEFRELEKAHLNTINLHYYETLFDLCRRGKLNEMFSIMEENSLDPLHEYDGSNLLILSASSGHLKIVQFLFEKCGFADRLDHRDKLGNSAVSEAKLHGHELVVEYLQQHGATLDGLEADLQSDNLHKTNFEKLLQCNEKTLGQLNVDYLRFESGELFLHHYIRCIEVPNEKLFRFLLTRYDTVDVRTSTTDSDENQHGETALHVALQSGKEICVKILLECGANVNATSHKYKLSSLHFAIMNDGVSEKMIEQLIVGYGIDVNAVDERGRTIAFYLSPNKRLWRLLIDRYGLDMIKPDNQGRTVLHHAVMDSSYFAAVKVEFLLRFLHFPQTHTDNDGRLPLHRAVEMNKHAIVVLLLKYRQDLLHVLDCEGISAVQLAQKMTYATISKVFHSLQQKCD
ncbi:uncharacterized protein LOC131207440 [Anopheles bellator]|uniref:uncharacterized protein LOC131207440 n=1 Tax=Anopheles bellator TaxID=139047 RepID=UPI00264A2DB1|nr:uncharacterized protein LOC131207440 [Anopheles bellator]